MQYKNILITGGAGFVGSNLGLKLKNRYPESQIFAFDNLKRRGSELNIKRLKDVGINFIHGDVRNVEDFYDLPKIDLILDCSAEPSVLSGLNSSTLYQINTNLTGTINCLELARKNKATFLFLSTSRVYPIETINSLNFIEEETRFSLSSSQQIIGVSENGIAENFPLNGVRSIYGATKLCSEIIIHEYLQAFGIKGVINRCSVISGPWQMGKADQGVFSLWIARHIFDGKLSYIGFGGKGKQVRDFLHIDDLFDVLDMEINEIDSFTNDIYNVGGGLENSVSLLELTKLCQEVTGRSIDMGSVLKNRSSDIKVFITDNKKITAQTGWKPKKGPREIVEDIVRWMLENKDSLRYILNN